MEPVPEASPAGPALRTRMIEPGPLAHAEALLSWLQRRYPPGTLLPAGDVEYVCYPLLLEQKGWRPRPWGSCKGVGKHLSKLPGVEKVSPYVVAEDGFKERISAITSIGRRGD